MTHERVKKKNKQRASEMNLAAILLCIVFLFLVCHFPRILLNVHELFMLGDMLACGAGKTLFCFYGIHRYMTCDNHRHTYKHSGFLPIDIGMSFEIAC